MTHTHTHTYLPPNRRHLEAHCPPCMRMYLLRLLFARPQRSRTSNENRCRSISHVRDRRRIGCISSALCRFRRPWPQPCRWNRAPARVAVPHRPWAVLWVLTATRLGWRATRPLLHRWRTTAHGTKRAHCERWHLCPGTGPLSIASRQIYPRTVAGAHTSCRLLHVLERDGSRGERGGEQEERCETYQCGLASR